MLLVSTSHILYNFLKNRGLCGVETPESESQVLSTFPPTSSRDQCPHREVLRTYLHLGSTSWVFLPALVWPGGTADPLGDCDLARLPSLPSLGSESVACTISEASSAPNIHRSPHSVSQATLTFSLLFIDSWTFLAISLPALSSLPVPCRVKLCQGKQP